ncbi:MAG: SDR family oxidoreductase [Niabella sp.]
MKILVTGSNGFVGGYVVQQLLFEGHQVFATSLTADVSSFFNEKGYQFLQANLTDAYAVHTVFDIVQPDVVVHCAAMSKPDDCEINQADAYAMNVEATVQLLLNADDYKSHFIHLSTDFIFNGAAGMHKEDDTPEPLNYYGKTKLEAEEAVKEYAYNWAIVRTVFVYGKTLHGRDSFITMIANRLKYNQPYKVVNDQERTPTYAGDLARGISSIIKKRASGVFHLCGKDVVTPYQMAIKTAAFLGIKDHLFTAVTSIELDEKAQRPLKSGLCIDKAIRELEYTPLNFEEGLKQTLEP